MKILMNGTGIAFLLLAACNSSGVNSAHINVDGVSPIIDVKLSHFEISKSADKLVLTWRAVPDAGQDTPFFQVYGILPTSGVEDPLWTKVAFTWPGVHGHSSVHGCGCMGTITKQIDEINQKATIDLDLIVPFQYDGGCPSYCDVTYDQTDAGEFFLPPHPCDAGFCLETISCPGQSLDPFLIHRNDLGEATIDYRFCENPNIVERTAHVVAHATGKRSEFSY